MQLLVAEWLDIRMDVRVMNHQGGKLQVEESIEIMDGQIPVLLSLFREDSSRSYCAAYCACLIW